jgi:iron complex transport system ATP-binding protein
VTHHVNEIIPEIDRVIMLREGEILIDGPKQDVLTEDNLSRLFGVEVRIHQHQGSFYIY